MDDCLRRQERLGRVGVVDLLRAGRLDPHRVALAAFLGHERALAASVPPWAPPPAQQDSSSRPLLPLEQLLADDGLTARQRVALLLGPVARGVERLAAEERARSSPQAAHVTRIAGAVLRSTQGWARGELSDLALAEAVESGRSPHEEYVRLLYVRQKGYDGLETAPPDLEPTLVVPHSPVDTLWITRGKGPWDHRVWGLVASLAGGGLLLGGAHPPGRVATRARASGLNLLRDICDLLDCATPEAAPTLLREVAETLLDPDALPRAPA